MSCVLLCGALAPSAGASAVHENQWYVVLIEGQRVGWMHVATAEMPEENEIRSLAETRITIRRGRLDMSIHIKTDFRETADGRPVLARVEQTLGQMGTSQSMTFGEAVLRVESEQEGRRAVQELPLPRVERDAVPGAWGGGWLPPAAAQRYVRERMGAGDREIKLWTLDPSLGAEPIHVWMAAGDRETIDVYGRSVAATVWDSTMSVLPGVVNREHVDDRGRMVKSTLAMIPGMSFTILAADEQLALSPVDPPELMAQTLVVPDRAIEDPRRVSAAEYEVSIVRDVPGAGGAGGAMPDDAARGEVLGAIPGTPVQAVSRVSDDTVRVRVSAAGGAAVDVAAPGERYLAASVVLAADDPKVLEHVSKALKGVGPGASSVQRAERLRRYVHGFIAAKDLSVGFATASEVARTGQGDCTEHAVLLAAMLRAAGIPSRTVSGLVYVDGFLGQEGVFGYHMWVQGWVADPVGDGGGAAGGAGRGRWVDLDATLEASSFDATHIALATSPMTDDAVMNDMVRLVPLIGRLKIRVVGVEHGGGLQASTPPQR